MRPKTINFNAWLLRPPGAAAVSGYSAKAIREGCRLGKIPHIKCGSDYLINMNVWMEMLNTESRNNLSKE